MRAGKKPKTGFLNLFFLGEYMTLNELAEILVQMYEDSENEKSLMIRLFGIRYADLIKASGFTATDIINQAYLLSTQISPSYDVEINKGIALARYVIEKQTLIDFVNNTGKQF
jgi:hypothetical protein